MRKKSKIISKAGVLLIAVFMVFSAIPAVMADTSDADNAAQNTFSLQGVGMPYVEPQQLEPTETFAGGGVFADYWISYNDGSTENALGLTNGGIMTMAIELTATELTGYYGQQIDEIKFSAGSDGQGAAAAMPYEIWIDTTQPAVSDLYDGTVDVYKSGTTDPAQGVWQTVMLDTIYDIPASGSVFVGVNFDHPAGEYPCGIDETTTSPARGALLTYEGSSWTDLGTAGFPGVWGLDVGVSEEDEEEGIECKPDQCDFAIDGFTAEFEQMHKSVDVDNDGEEDYWAFNSEPHELCVDIANLGDVAIGEVKLMADVYKKVCPPSFTMWDDPKYDLQQFPCCGNNYPFEFPNDDYTPVGDEPVDPEDRWHVGDDGDGDSWALQGGDENRWLTNNQAWRCTKGEDRSFGVDEDVYLGKDPSATVIGRHDNLTTPEFNIAGAACADISFSHWCEGEYTVDDDGCIVPADYGTLAYSLDAGATWTELGSSPGNQKFVAYDTNGEWQDVSIKFINTEIDATDHDYMHPYNMVCDECQPEEGDIVVKDNLSDARLKLRFIWHKDPCLQYEGWYIDGLTVQQTGDYQLELECQTHEIIEMAECDPEEDPWWGSGKDACGDETGEFINGLDAGGKYCFPLACEFEDETWYEVHIYGQVFDPEGCEIEIANNEFKTQFKIMDIHDLKCVDMYFTGDPDNTTKNFVIEEEEVLPDQCDAPGPANVGVTAEIKNVGTFAEPKDKISVDLMKGDIVKDILTNDKFETDSLGDYSIYYFTLEDKDGKEYGSKVPWRWSKGDSFISKIYENDPNQARSRNPGSECLVGAQEGGMPTLHEDSMSVISPGVVDFDPNDNWVESGNEPDCDDPCDAEMSFEIKFSMDVKIDEYYGDVVKPGSGIMLGIMPAEGPGSGWVHFKPIDEVVAFAQGYSNDWVSVDLDYEDLVGYVYSATIGYDYFDDCTGEKIPYNYLPDCEIGLFIFAEGNGVNLLPADPDGGTVNEFNPVPWTGVLIDNWYYSVSDVENMEAVSTNTIEEDELLPGESTTVDLVWDDIELCQHGLEIDVNLEGDIDPNNDRCCLLKVNAHQEARCFESYYEDLTAGGECHWHACTNREGGDNYFAWTGVESEHSAQYLNNMDEGLVTPTIDLSYDWETCDMFMINFTTWYDLKANDFVDVDIFDSFDHDNDMGWHPDVDGTANITKWKNIGKIYGTSEGVFEDWSLPIDKTSQNLQRTKVRFRMYSNDEDVGEGCYIDEFRIVNATPSGSFAPTWLKYNDGSTENAFAWNDGTPWTGCIELDAAKLGANAGDDISEIRVSTGCDDYGFYAAPFDVYYNTGAAGAPTISGATLVDSFVGDSSGWGEYTLSSPQATPDNGDSAYLMIQWHDYGSMYPAGFDTDSFDDRGAWTIDHGTTDTWILLDDLGYDAVYGIDAGMTAGTSDVEYLEDLPVLTWMDDQNDIPCHPSEIVELPDYPYVNMEGIGSFWPEADTFERGTITPWTCAPSTAGQWWIQWCTDLSDTSNLPNNDEGAEDITLGQPCGPDCNEGWYTIPSENLVSYGYPATGTGLDNALAFELDLTAETLDQSYLEFCAAINYDLSQETAYIEFSPDWEPGTPMESATWVTYWVHTPGDSYGDDTHGWIYLEDLTDFDDDNRWNIDEYIGSKVFVRFRLESDGNGAAIGEGFAVDDIHLRVKNTGEAFVDEVPPQTSIFFNQQTGAVQLSAIDFPEGKASGVAATYYKIDGGEQQQGREFTIPEGTHTVEYWSVDNAGNEESHKTAEYTVDTTDPTVDITEPVEGGIYLLDNKVLSLGSKTICVGKFTVVAEPDDGDGSGIDYVSFTISGAATDSGFADSAPYEYLFKKMAFGSLTIEATAADMGGRTASDEITVSCYSLGLL